MNLPLLHGVRSSGLSPVIRDATFADESMDGSVLGISQVLNEIVEEFQGMPAAVTENRSIAVIALDANWVSPLSDLLPPNVRFLTPRDSKGLEFDFVIIVNSCSIHNSGTTGVNSLYVALSRASQVLE